MLGDGEGGPRAEVSGDVPVKFKRPARAFMRPGAGRSNHPFGGGTPMAKVKNVEKRIWDTEGFAVVIKYNGRDVRSDYQGMPQYGPYERMAKNDMTVSQWRDLRFSPSFADYDVDALDGDGNVCNGNTKLGTVRDTSSD
jgi:hypothetical protein